MTGDHAIYIIMVVVVVGGAIPPCRRAASIRSSGRHCAYVIVETVMDNMLKERLNATKSERAPSIQCEHTVN